MTMMMVMMIVTKVVVLSNLNPLADFKSINTFLLLFLNTRTDFDMISIIANKNQIPFVHLT